MRLVSVWTMHELLLTPGLTGSVHGDLYSSVISGHLWWVGEYCDCQRETLACGDIKRTSNDVQSVETMTRIHL